MREKSSDTKKDYMIYGLSAVLAIVLLINGFFLVNHLKNTMLVDARLEGRQEVFDEIAHGLETQGTYSLILSVGDGHGEQVDLAPIELIYEQANMDMIGEIIHNIETAGNVQFTYPTQQGEEQMILVPYHGDDVGAPIIDPSVPSIEENSMSEPIHE